MNSMTVDQYKKEIASNSKRKASTSKFKNKPTTIDGYRFHSIKEANYYKMLKDQQSKGEIARFHPQVCFLLPGGIKHFVDFMVITPISIGGHDFFIDYIEVKGRDTPMGKLKRKQCEDIYKIEITVI
jgi:hypothetical protein